MVQLLEKLRADFRDRAAGLKEFSPSAAKAFAVAAETVAENLKEYLGEPLSIGAAALEFGWNAEALRQRLHREGLLDRRERRYAVTRRVMTEQVGYGRGPRRTSEKSPASVEVESKPIEGVRTPDLDPALRTALSRALQARNNN